MQRAEVAAPEQRSYNGTAFMPSYEGIGTDVVGELHAMQSMALFACVRLLADVIASMPWYVYKRDKDNVPRRIYPSPAVIRRPCADMDLFEWKWMVVFTLALRGNSYHMITGRDNAGNPTGLMPIHPDMIFLERRINVLEWYDPIYRVLGERVPREDIIHIRRFTVPGEPYGMSPIRQAARAIGISLAAEEYGYRYFQDSANPSSILRTDQHLEPEEVERNQKEWIASNGGRRLPAVLSGGFDWKPISISPQESQFLATREYQIADIARLYGIPPHLIGDQTKATSWGSGIESLNLGFAAYTLAGWTTCIESAISSSLPGGKVIRFDPSVLLRGDVKTRYEAYQLARNTGFMNVDEIRGAEEKGPLPDGLGQGYIQPVNYAPIGFDPAVVPMPKSIQGGTEPGGSESVPAGTEPSHEPPPSGHGQEPEPPGVANARSLTPQCHLGSDGRPHYYDPHTGETVNLQEEK